MTATRGPHRSHPLPPPAKLVRKSTSSVRAGQATFADGFQARNGWAWRAARMQVDEVAAPHLSGAKRPARSARRGPPSVRSSPGRGDPTGKRRPSGRAAARRRYSSLEPFDTYTAKRSEMHPGTGALHERTRFMKQLPQLPEHAQPAQLAEHAQLGARTTRSTHNSRNTYNAHNSPGARATRETRTTPTTPTTPRARTTRSTHKLAEHAQLAEAVL
jgi:hypothetical protein